ncbi:MAG: hypothetical protein OCC46_11130 [Pseudodesulfovibrio sp.]
MTEAPTTPLIEGVFSIDRKGKIGTGTTAKRVEQTVLYYAKQVDEDTVDLQLLNPKNVPFGTPDQVTKDELLNDYTPMPDLLKEVLANLRQVNKSLARGDKFRKRGESFTAEFEFTNALNLDEENVRANFGIGLCLLERDEEERAKEVFDRIINIESAFEDEHKHLFNEYGIALRKKKLGQQAVDYYKRALDLSGQDENLWFNLARAHFDTEDWTQCATAAAKCVELSPDHPEGKKVLAYLAKKELV